MKVINLVTTPPTHRHQAIGTQGLWPAEPQDRTNLAYWVMRVIGYEAEVSMPEDLVGEYDGYAHLWNPCYDWAQGGPLLEKYAVELAFTGPNADERCMALMFNDESDPHPLVMQFGDSYLIAGMRAIVCSVYGDEVPEL